MRWFFALGLSIFATSTFSGVAFSQESDVVEVERMLFSDPAAALPLLKQDLRSNPSPQLEVYTAFARFKIAEESQMSAASLRRSIKRYLASEESGTREIGLIFNEFARYELEREDPDDARSISVKAEEFLREAAPDDIESIGRAMSLTGISHLIDAPVTRGGIARAYEYFKRARELHNGEEENAQMSLSHAEAVAWQAAAGGKMATYYRKANEAEPFGGGFILRDDADCAGLWSGDRYYSIRTKISWAEHLIEHGVPYGLVLAVDVASDGSPENIRMIGEARRPSLSTDVKAKEKHRAGVIPRALNRWRANSEDFPAKCLKDRILVFAGYYPPEYVRSELGIQTNPGHQE